MPTLGSGSLGQVAKAPVVAAVAAKLVLGGVQSGSRRLGERSLLHPKGWMPHSGSILGLKMNSLGVVPLNRQLEGK